MCFSQEILTHRLPGKDANMVDKSLTKTDVDLIFAKVVQILARFGRLVLGFQVDTQGMFIFTK